MENGYPVTVLYPYYDWPILFCICETEADAQEMVLSLEEENDYDKYLHYLKYDYTVQPHNFIYQKPHYKTTIYEAIMSF